MSWIGLTDLKRSHFNPAGIGASAEASNAANAGKNAILPVGTLIVETEFQAQPDAPQQVLHYERTKDWHRALSVTLTDRGAMHVAVSQGNSHFAADLTFHPPERETTIRLYYSWNGPERWARLALKVVDTDEFWVATVDDPLPMPMLDALTIMRNGHATHIEPKAHFAAISDRIEPIGLAAGICAGTPIETPSGAVPIERLRLGDHVVTATSGVQPVRWITKRIVPALGAFRPMRLRAPFFGLENDLLLAPDHRIRVGGAEAEYLVGEDDVLLKTKRLTGSKAAWPEDRLKFVTYYSVLLDHHDCLLHDTVWSESLYVGRIAKDAPRLAATALAEMPITAIPIHRGFARHRLTEHEARSLAMVLHR